MSAVLDGPATNAPNGCAPSRRCARTRRADRRRDPLSRTTTTTRAARNSAARSRSLDDAIHTAPFSATPSGGLADERVEVGERVQVTRRCVRATGCRRRTTAPSARLRAPRRPRVRRRRANTRVTVGARGNRRGGERIGAGAHLRRPRRESCRRLDARDRGRTRLAHRGEDRLARARLRRAHADSSAMLAIPRAKALRRRHRRLARASPRPRGEARERRRQQPQSEARQCARGAKEARPIEQPHRTVDREALRQRDMPALDRRAVASGRAACRGRSSPDTRRCTTRTASTRTAATRSARDRGRASARCRSGPGTVEP